ncbi:MAG TPA: hypothetical protein VFY25_09675 [Anaerolineales bacterium]|nr:hypothetical protein [Anaerolineales bacterium]
MAKNVLTDILAEPLNGLTTAKIDIHVGDGNLTIDRLTGGEPVLASGTLQYFENQGVPKRTLDSRNGQATFTLKGGHAGRPWFHFPWSACNGATEWQIHLNPTVSSDITAHSDGGNLKLNLAGMTVTHLATDTGGGNVEVVLPEDIANLSATARTGGGNVKVELGSRIIGSNIINANSGAGNVEVDIPGSVAARIHATTGLGKAIVDPRFSKIDKSTYQSSDFERALNKVEITLGSGAGNVIVNTR